MLQINFLKQGYTLIELLFTIAIIGILATVVVAAMSNARHKGRDAYVKSNLNNMIPQTQIVFDTHNDYSMVCADEQIARVVEETNGVCVSALEGWTLTSPLSSSTIIYCVDSEGEKLETNTMVATTTGWTLGTHNCASL